MGAPGVLGTQPRERAAVPPLRQEIVLEGDIPSAMNPPSGCPFQTRCPRKLGKICEEQAPPIRVFGKGHKIACHIAPDDLLRMEPVIVMGAKEAAE